MKWRVVQSWSTQPLRLPPPMHYYRRRPTSSCPQQTGCGKILSWAPLGPPYSDPAGKANPSPGISINSHSYLCIWQMLLCRVTCVENQTHDDLGIASVMFYCLSLMHTFILNVHIEMAVKLIFPCILVFSLFTVVLGWRTTSSIVSVMMLMLFLIQRWVRSSSYDMIND